MNREQLMSLLRTAGSGRRDRSSTCPDEERIAAYVDGALEPDNCEQLELHLADCERCIALVGLLSRQRGSGATEPVPDSTLARARNLVTSRHWQRYAPQWAAAAMVILSIVAVSQFAQLGGSGLEHPMQLDERSTRNVLQSKPTLQVLYPIAGTTLESRRLAFRWTEIPGSDYYDVRIVSESGDVVREQRVTGTEWRPTEQLALQPGAEYFVHVDAYPSKAKTVSSDHVPFSVSDRP